MDPYVKDLFQVIAWVFASVGGLIAAFVAIRQANLSRAQSRFEHQQALRLELYKELGDRLLGTQEALVDAITATNSFVDRAQQLLEISRPVAPNDARFWDPQRVASAALDSLIHTLDKYEILFTDTLSAGDSVRAGPLPLTEAAGRFALVAAPFISSSEQPNPTASQLEVLRLKAAEYQALAMVLHERIGDLRVHAQNALLGPLLGRRLALPKAGEPSSTRSTKN